jgi:hypothetical protein
MSLTEPQSNLLRAMGLKLTGFDLHYIRGERGRTSVSVNGKSFQPRTADALIQSGHIEVVAESDVSELSAPGEIFKICRLAPKGWREIGLPIEDREPPVVFEVVDYLEQVARKADAEDAKAPVPEPPPDACGQSDRAKLTNKNRHRDHEKARRKQERKSRRINR